MNLTRIILVYFFKILVYNYSIITVDGREQIDMNTIITIGRQYGSGGREIGIKLAEACGIECYDKELLQRAAKESGLCEDLFVNHDEKPTNSFLYSLVMDTYLMGGYSSASFLDMPINHKIFLAQFDTIKKIGDNGPCVIVGRCADYALAEYKNCVNLFIHADIKNRIERISNKLEISKEKAKDVIHKTDKRRSSYYNYYSNKKWGEAKGYHLSIDSGILGIDETVELIKKFIELKERE